MGDENSNCRYRGDNYLLRFWFRSIETFAPWVNRIHFVSCGQLPDWLNTTHPKISIVHHKDFIPDKYLPTFNSRTIEMNLHRIDSLSERYVLFNDDMYLLQKISPEFFFRDNSPVLPTDLRYQKSYCLTNWNRTLFNDYCLVNSSFNIRSCIWKNRAKWFSVKDLGFKRARQNFICFLANKSLPVGMYGHLALPHLKSTLSEIWDKWSDYLDTMSAHKFRNDNQVNQWLLCAWNQAKGMFYPVNEAKIGKRIVISPQNTEYACHIIRNQSIPQICPNDTSYNTEYITSCNLLTAAFSSIFPERSSFEVF